MFTASGFGFKVLGTYAHDVGLDPEVWGDRLTF